MIPYSPPPPPTIPSPAQYNVESAKKTIDTRVQHCMWGGVEWGWACVVLKKRNKCKFHY